MRRFGQLRSAAGLVLCATSAVVLFGAVANAQCPQGWPVNFNCNRIVVAPGEITSISNPSGLGAPIYGVDYLPSIENQGTVTALSNSGSVQLASNDAGGVINTFINNTGGQFTNVTGVYFGSPSVSNFGAINLLSNSGSIIAGYIGEAMSNTGSISSLVNSAQGVIGGPTGINNNGNIQFITNFGSIYSNPTYRQPGGVPLYNTGYIGTLNNMSGGTIAPYQYPGPYSTDYAIYNIGRIDVIANNGVIYGATGIYNTGTIGLISNIAGGTISSRLDSGYYGINNSGTINVGMWISRNRAN